MSQKTSRVRTLNWAAIIAPLLFCLLLAPRAFTQAIPLPGQAQPDQAEVEREQQQKHAAEKAANAKRQQDIKKDTDKLLELATELKQYVDKSNENTLSVDVVKKAEEIEKLAHTIRDKMKGQ